MYSPRTKTIVLETDENGKLNVPMLSMNLDQAKYSPQNQNQNTKVRRTRRGRKINQNEEQE